MAFKTFAFLKSAAAIGAQTASSTSDVEIDLGGYNEFALQLGVSAAATEVGDILATWVQTSLDGGTNWHDVGRFADVLGNGGAVVRKMQFVTGAVTTAEEAKQDAAVTASTVRSGPIGDRLRLKWTITDAGADNASFTFTCVGSARG